MGAHNPTSIRICSDGVTRDKYGRSFTIDSRDFKRRMRKKVRDVTPAILSLKVTN